MKRTKKISTLFFFILILTAQPVLSFEKVNGLCLGLIDYSELQDNDFKRMKKLNITYLRFTVFWEGIEKEKGVFDWRRMDRIISLARNNQIQPVLVIGYLPKYLREKKNTFDFTNSEHIKNYISFLKNIVNRYPDVIYYEIWNEPDLKKFWSYSYKEYIELLKLSSKIIKGYNKKAKVTNGGISGKNISYIRKLLHDTEGYIDFLSIHFYYHWNKPKYMSASCV